MVAVECQKLRTSQSRFWCNQIDKNNLRCEWIAPYEWNLVMSSMLIKAQLIGIYRCRIDSESKSLFKIQMKSFENILIANYVYSFGHSCMDQNIKCCRFWKKHSFCMIWFFYSKLFFLLNFQKWIYVIICFGQKLESFCYFVKTFSFYTIFS